MVRIMNLEKIYDKRYKLFVLIPVLLILFSVVVLVVNNANTGDILNKDVSLSGGVSATLEMEDLDKEEIENYLGERYTDFNVRELTDFSTRERLGYILDVADTTEDELTSYLDEKYELGNENYNVNSTGSSFGESFYKDILVALLFAFLFMAISVFITFRTFVPSLAVIFAAFVDIITTVAIVTLMGIKVSPAGLITFLLVIGYSIDTDILLTTRMLRRKEWGLYKRLKSAMTTGLTMTGTTIVALLVAFFVSTSPQLKQMFLIMLIAMFVDIISTYTGNAGILIWYCKRKKLT